MLGCYFGFWGGGLTNFPHLGVWGFLVEFGSTHGEFGCGDKGLRAAAVWSHPASFLVVGFSFVDPLPDFSGNGRAVVQRKPLCVNGRRPMVYYNLVVNLAGGQFGAGQPTKQCNAGIVPLGHYEGN